MWHVTAPGFDQAHRAKRQLVFNEHAVEVDRRAAGLLVPHLEFDAVRVAHGIRCLGAEVEHSAGRSTPEEDRIGAARRTGRFDIVDVGFSPWC